MKRLLLAMALVISLAVLHAQTHVTVSGIVVDTVKVFDDNDTALVRNQGFLSDVAQNDTVFVHTEAHYDTTNASSGKTITVTSSLFGPHAASYVLDNPVFTLTGTILKRQLYRDSVVPQPVKFYDGTVACQIQFSGIPRNYVTHHVLITIDTCEFLDPNAGNNKPVRVKFGAYGEDEDNYLPPHDTTLIASILPRILVAKNLTIQRQKEYDQTNEAIVTSRGWFTNVLEGDTINFDFSAYYDDKNVGTGKSIHTHYEISGPDTMNYEAPADGVITNGEITAIRLKAQGGDADTIKYFDGTTDCMVRSSSQPVGVLQGEQVFLNTMAQYDNPNVGYDHDIKFYYTIYGEESVNYLAPFDSVFCHNGVILADTLPSAVESVSIDIALSPNPCGELLSITVDNGGEAVHDVIIYNVSGIEVMRESFAGPTVTMNLSALPEGTYFLRMDGRTKKFVKNR